MNFCRTSAALLFASFSLHCSAGVPNYDNKQPQRDGVVLVGMECHHQNRTLELGVFFPINPPQKRMDLWKTSDLVKFNQQTWMLEDVFVVEKRCSLAEDRYRIRFEGVPGANNAMWICGASTGVHASVWKNGRLVFDEDLYRCSQDSYARRVAFRRGVDAPEIVREGQ